MNGITFETPQFLYMRIALAVNEGRDKDSRLKHIKKYYNMLSKKKINLPSPNLSFIGTTKKTGTSCCLSVADDNIPSLVANDHVAYMMTVASAGIGNNLMTRSRGVGVRGNTIKHLGKLPYYRVIEALVKANMQSGRGGAATTYFSCLDPEVETLIHLRNPSSIAEKRIDGIDYALLYNNFFCEKVAKGEDWMLIDYSIAKDLYAAFYSQDLLLFRALYAEYAANDSVKKTFVKARDLALRFLSEEEETGRFYDGNIYEMNYHTPFLDPIYSSNLCTEICLPTKPFSHISDLYDPDSADRLFISLSNDVTYQIDGKAEVKILMEDENFEENTDIIKANNLRVGQSIAIGPNQYFEVVKIENHSNEVALCNIAAIVQGNVTDDEYEDACYYALCTIDYVINNSEYVLPQVGYTAKNRMSAGVGITNLAYEMAKNKKYYNAKSGKEYLHFIAERHYFNLVKASLRIAKERGNAPWIHKTKWPTGWTPLETYNKNVDSIADFKLVFDWVKLKEEIIKQGGIAHSVLCANMPCESSSQSLNTTNGLYAIRQGVVVKQDGSHKNVFIAPDWENLKDYYTIAWDISTKDMIDVYAIMQKFCDQASSADYYRSYSSEGDDRSLDTKEMLTNFLYRAKMGVKLKYYTNSSTTTANEVSGCGSGGCTL